MAVARGIRMAPQVGILVPVRRVAMRAGPSRVPSTYVAHHHHQICANASYALIGAKRPVVSGPEVEEIADFFSQVCSRADVYNMELDARLGR